MRKIAIITGTRAEFGLLRPLIEGVQRDRALQLQLVVTAMHLSPEFGYTVKEIEELGYTIDKRVECLVSSDTAVGVTKSLGLALFGFAEAFNELEPDLVIILGDRSEMLAAATSALIANIPIGHIHGGETTEGAYDESIRHAITKMSYLHFASTEIYRERIIQLGEHPDRVFNVGAIGLDSIRELKLLGREEFENAIDFKLGKKNILITFHPVTLENNSSESQFQALLDAILELKNTKFIFTHANSDKNGRVINKMIENFVSSRPDIAIDFKSMGQLKYLSGLKHVDLVLGNSSSGILEAPYMEIPSVNIGDRQKGRITPDSVIQVENDTEDIKRGIELAFDRSFRKKVKSQDQLYGNGHSTEKIINVLNEFSVINLKKKFFDINFKK